MEYIALHEFLLNPSDALLLDVRSPAEYETGHIPGAVNIPLFTNDERAQVGTEYKQRSPEKALLLGLDIIGPKMSEIIKQVKKYKVQDVIVHCWRGGKRSQSMAWLLGFAGFNVKYIQGGYKEYRRNILSSEFFKNFKIIILGGRTGMGKTGFIHTLRDMGEQVIDLEEQARHKGSAFGHLGESSPPTNEQFENNVASILQKFDRTKRIWVENESRLIGGIVIVQELWNKMKAAPLLNIEVSEKQRLNNILNDYGHFSKEELIASFKKIEKRIGGQNLKIAIEAIEEDDLTRAIQVALKYYDKTYDYNLSVNTSPDIHKLSLDGENIQAQTKTIINYADRNIRFN